MAKDKKSFLVYCDIIYAIEHLTNEEKGRLFQHLLEYVNDLNPVLEDRILISCWKPIELQLKRDLKKYEKIRERNSKNGSLGGRPKKPTKPIGFINNPTEPKKADTVTDTVTDNDIYNLEQLRIEFQNKYPKGTNPISLLTSLQQLPKEEQTKAIKYIPKYVKKTEPKFIMKPENYLNSYVWNDKESIEPVRRLNRISLDESGELTSK